MGNALANIDSPQDFFDKLPTFTKWWLISVFATTFAISFGFIPYVKIAYFWPFVWEKFELWRLVTAFTFFGKFSFGFLFKLMMLVSFCWGYEADPFPTSPAAGAGGRSGDFMLMILCGMAMFWVVGYFFQFLFLSNPLLYMIMYVWSKRHPDEQVTLLFGMKCRGLYLPFVLAILSMVIGQDITAHIAGAAVGHLYYFLIRIVPNTYGRSLLWCPQFLYTLMESFDNQENYVGNAGGGQPQPPPRRNMWGAGQVLGEQ